MNTIELHKGNPYSKSVEIKDSAGNALDLTGRTIFCSVKSLRDDADTDAEAVITKEVTSHSDPTNGQSVITFTEDDTDIEPGLYIADIKVYGEGLNANTDPFYIEIIRPKTERIS
ncbi:MAG: hypothetical protein D4R45_07700 [Planctomycetaceae bacterium]|nr:MAG: hypothetical protein D4R45_07700 [Planctomycetaceae bacterium]